MIANIEKHSIHYIQEGPSSGIPIVLIHGFPFNSDMWKPQIQALQKSFRVVVYDLLGHGKSAKGSGQYTIEEHVDLLFSFCESLKIQKPVILGFSMGGYIALRAMERNASFFKGFVLCDTKSESDTDEGKLKRFQSVKDVRTKGVEAFADGFIKNVLTAKTLTDNKDLVQHVRSMITSTSSESITGHLIALAARTDTTNALSKFKIPALIMVGDQDVITTPANAKSMHEKIQGSTMQVIPQAAHMSNLENPASFNGHLIRFLDSLR